MSFKLNKKINNFFLKFSRRASRSGKVPLSSSGSGASGVGGGGGGPSGAGGGVATSSGSGAAMDGTGTDGSAPHSSGGAIPPNASAPSSSSVPTGETIHVKLTSSDAIFRLLSTAGTRTRKWNPQICVF